MSKDFITQEYSGLDSMRFYVDYVTVLSQKSVTFNTCEGLSITVSQRAVQFLSKDIITQEYSRLNSIRFYVDYVTALS